MGYFYNGVYWSLVDYSRYWKAVSIPVTRKEFLDKDRAFDIKGSNPNYSKIGKVKVRYNKKG